MDGKMILWIGMIILSLFITAVIFPDIKMFMTESENPESGFPDHLPNTTHQYRLPLGIPGMILTIYGLYLVRRKDAFEP